MYCFFEKHKILRLFLDYLVLCGVAFVIFYLFKGIDFSVAWFTPIYINLFVTCLFFYVDKVHNAKTKRMTFFQWLNSIRWINGIGLVLHTTIGYYTKYSHEQVVRPLWTQDKNNSVIAIAIYLVCILVPSLIIYLKKYKNREV